MKKLLNILLIILTLLLSACTTPKQAPKTHDTITHRIVWKVAPSDDYSIAEMITDRCPTHPIEVFYEMATDYKIVDYITIYNVKEKKWYTYYLYESINKGVE